MIKENQKQELNRIRHEIEVAKLKLELEQLKMLLPIEVQDIQWPSSLKEG